MNFCYIKSKPSPNALPNIDGCKLKYVASERYIEDHPTALKHVIPDIVIPPKQQKKRRKRRRTCNSNASKPRSDHIYGVPRVNARSPGQICHKRRRSKKRKRSAKGSKKRKRSSVRKPVCYLKPEPLCDETELRRLKRKFLRQKYCNIDSDPEMPSWRREDLHPKVIRERKDCPPPNQHGLTGCGHARGPRGNQGQCRHQPQRGRGHPMCDGRCKPEVIFVPVYQNTPARGRAKARRGKRKGRCRSKRSAPASPCPDYSDADFSMVESGNFGGCGSSGGGNGMHGYRSGNGGGPSRCGSNGMGEASCGARCSGSCGSSCGDRNAGNSFDTSSPCNQLINKNIHHPMPDKLCAQTLSALERFSFMKKPCFRKKRKSKKAKCDSINKKDVVKK